LRQQGIQKLDNRHMITSMY